MNRHLIFLLIFYAANLFNIQAAKEEEKNIIVRIEGRNKKEIDMFNKYIEKERNSFMVYNSLVRTDKKRQYHVNPGGECSCGHQEGAQCPIISAESFNKITANMDIILKSRNSLGEIVNSLYISLPANGIGFNVEPGFRYIIRTRPCNKEESNYKQASQADLDLFNKLFDSSKNDFTKLVRIVEKIENMKSLEEQNQAGYPNFGVAIMNMDFYCVQKVPIDQKEVVGPALWQLD